MKKFSICLLGIVATAATALCGNTTNELSEADELENYSMELDQDEIAGKDYFPDGSGPDESALPETTGKNMKKSDEDRKSNEKPDESALPQTTGKNKKKSDEKHKSSN